MKKYYSGLFVLVSGLFFIFGPFLFGRDFDVGVFFLAVPVLVIGIIIVFNKSEDKIEQIIKN